MPIMAFIMNQLTKTWLLKNNIFLAKPYLNKLIFEYNFFYECKYSIYIIIITVKHFLPGMLQEQFENPCYRPGPGCMKALK